MAGVLLNVDGKEKFSVDVTYDDLVWLYGDFVRRNGHAPRTSECLSKNNLPQQRIVTRVLEVNNVTMNEFLNQFGKFSHVRSDIKNYDSYIKKYIDISNEIGRPLNGTDLLNNAYGLPSLDWMIRNCPDESVNGIETFAKWCGLDYIPHKLDKVYVSNTLHELEDRLQRPIRSNDIKDSTVGFSMIVINRIWGGLDNCKQEIGLAATPKIQPLPFSYYKNLVDSALKIIEKEYDRRIITWSDLESIKIDNNSVSHKSIVASFSREGIDFFRYVYDKGFQMKPNKFSYRTILPSGEKVTSTFEYDFSLFVNNIGYVYNVDYNRDVRYCNFSNYNKKSKMNCDYVFGDKCIEIFGILQNKDGDWRTRRYNDDKTNEYLEKSLLKESILKGCDKPFLFLFPEDFRDGSYKEKFLKFIGK